MTSETTGASDDPGKDLTIGLRKSLNAKLERLLERPIIAKIVHPDHVEELPPDDGALPDMFLALESAARELSTARPSRPRRDPWTANKDGTSTVSIRLDYEDVWRGDEKEILDAVSNTVEGLVTFLTDEQRKLLERSPREFLALHCRPETAELVNFDTEREEASPRRALEYVRRNLSLSARCACSGKVRLSENRWSLRRNRPGMNRCATRPMGRSAFSRASSSAAGSHRECNSSRRNRTPRVRSSPSARKSNA